MSVPVKAYFVKNGSSTEIRRFTVDFVDFQNLKLKVGQVFPGVQQETAGIAWRDEEGDMIEMSSDEELQLALKSRKDSLFRIFIKQNVPADRGDEKTGDGATHPGVVCDVCDNGIVGFRFKCLMCPDYDLCSGCERTGVHAQHYMLRISPETIGTDQYAPAWRPMWHAFRRFFNGPKGHHRGAHPGGWRGGCPWAQREEWRFPGRNDANKPECHKETGERAESSSTHYAAPPPPPFNPEEMIQKMGAAFENLFKRKSSSENNPNQTTTPHDVFEQYGPAGDYLKHIGESVAALLDPLGIDVEVNVQKEGQDYACHVKGKGGSQSQSASAAEKPAEVPPTELQQGQVPQPHAAAEEPLINITVDEEKRKTPSLDGDWTYVDKKDASATMATPPESPEPKTTTPTSREETSSGARPKSAHGPPISSLADEMNRVPPVQPQPVAPSVPLHPNRKIAEGLQQMLSMGFTNEGGWLTQLLEIKDGNLDSVLDVLHPVTVNNQHKREYV